MQNKYLKNKRENWFLIILESVVCVLLVPFAIAYIIGINIYYFFRDAIKQSKDW